MGSLLWVLVVVLHSLVIQAQDNCQQVFPSRVSYRTGVLQNPNVDDGSNCDDSTQVTVCTDSSVLTDNSLGPQNYVASGSSYYLLNNDVDTQILFNFSRSVLLSTIQLYYYIDAASAVSLPKMRISLVENFQVSQTLSDSVRSLTIDAVDANQGPAGRNSITARLVGEFSATTFQILLRIQENKVHSLALSEIIFCENQTVQPPTTNGQNPPETTSTQSTTTTPTTRSTGTMALTTGREPTSRSDFTTPTRASTTRVNLGVEGSTSSQVTIHKATLSTIISIATLYFFVLAVLR